MGKIGAAGTGKRYYRNKTHTNMATTSLTLVGNPADSRGLAERRDSVYCHA
jgi:hypothetical protein